MSASPPPADSRQARKRRGPTGDERPAQKPRTQRTTLACERCRTKKLRCMGGHPCSTCKRAKADCDFGDRGLDSQQSISATNQRLSQLEKTVTELVAGLGHLTNPRPLSHAVPRDQLFLAGSPRHVSALEHPPCLEAPPLSDAQTTAVPGLSPPVHSPSRASPEPVRSSSVNPRASERLESRWDALQHNSAPFPPLMNHPTAWSGEPSKTSPDAVKANLTLGMTHYKAHVHLQSEPISEGIVSDAAARALFALFFQKCHPSFPLLETSTDPDSHFDTIRSSSPFLLSSTLAIAGRYFNGYQNTQPAASRLPLITPDALEALADLAGAHLGFVLLRKQHELSDVQAALLLSVWIPRGRGQSADQWMVTGLCTRLAYRIGIPDLPSRPAVLRFASSTNPSVDDIHEVNSILPQWHTWLILNQYDTSLSLGFGRPHTMPFADANPRQYLNVARKLASSAQVDLAAATYVASLVELCTISTDLIAGLRRARLRPAPSHDDQQPVATAWAIVSALLSDLNLRLDEWQRQWTWGGSYNAITLGSYTRIVTIYGEHARLCLNSLSLNLLAAGGDGQNHDLMPYLARACEAAVSLVQSNIEPCGTEPIVRYGGEYLVLILGQAAVFFVRMLAARLEQPLPIDQLVLLHYLKKAIDLLESNDLSTTGVCSWVAQITRELARFSGLSLDNEGDEINACPAVPDSNLQETEWDFDVCAFLGQSMAGGETDLELGSYFDFTQSFLPALSGTHMAGDKANPGSKSSTR